MKANDAPCRPGTRGAAFIYSCPVVLGPQCALQAQEVTRSARDRLYSRRPCARPDAKKRFGLAVFSVRRRTRLSFASSLRASDSVRC
eukprot:3817142-Prymnesium_polylepis.1